MVDIIKESTCSDCGRKTLIGERIKLGWSDRWRSVRLYLTQKYHKSGVGEESFMGAIICADCHSRITGDCMIIDDQRAAPLALGSPGKFMENFDPEKSGREMRKMNRRIYKDNLKKNQLYDDNGRFIEDSSDVCDCLEDNCPGCHFNCPKCGSPKCGSDCRCNRRWLYQYVEVEGSSRVMRNTKTIRH